MRLSFMLIVSVLVSGVGVVASAQQPDENPQDQQEREVGERAPAALEYIPRREAWRQVFESRRGVPTPLDFLPRDEVPSQLEDEDDRQLPVALEFVHRDEASRAVRERPEAEDEPTALEFVHRDEASRAVRERPEAEDEPTALEFVHREEALQWGDEEQFEDSGPFDELVEPADDQLVIVEVALPEMMLTRDMFAYYDPAREQLLVPLRSFTELTELAVEVDTERVRAEGWFISEDRRFELDLSEGTVAVDEHTEPLEPGRVERHFDDVYVEIDLLGEWFSFDADFNFALMRLELDPKYPFPPQQRRMRQQQRERIRELVVDDEPAYEVVTTPYQLWSKPVHELTLQGGWPPSFLIEGDDRRRRTVAYGNRYQLRGAGDLLYTNAHWSIEGSERHPLGRVQLRFQRTDPDGELMGPAEATEIRGGDIVSPSTPMVARTDRGRGIEMSNFPLTHPRAFDRTTIQGPKEPGWEVELYRNGELLDFQQDPSEDYYYFEDVPLLFGTNELRVVQYGPHGETKEEVHRYRVGSDMISPGDDHYRVVFSQHNSDLIPIGTRRRNTTIDGQPRGLIEYERGILERLSVAGRINSLPMRNGRQRLFATAGVRSAFEQVYTAFDMVLSNGLGAKAAAQTQLWGLNVSAETAQFFGGFTSEAIPYETNPLRNRSRLRLNGLLPIPREHRVPFSLTLDNDYRSELGSRTRLMGRLSTHLHGVSLVNNLRLHRHPDSRMTLHGGFSAYRRTRTITPRAQVSYDLQGLRSYRLGMEWRLRDDLQMQGDIVHEFGLQHDLTIRTGVSYRRDRVEVGGGLGLSHSGGVSAGLSVSTAIGHNPGSDQWEPTSARLTSGGRVAPRVFWDKTGDGVFDEQYDEPLEDVEFVVDGGGTHDRSTGDEGIAVLSDLRTDEYSDIEISRRSLHDPFLVPHPEGFSVVARPGVQTYLDFPVVMTGEIDGTVRVRRHGITDPASGFTVQLLDEDDEVVDETTTAFDGFYLFDFVRPGNYTVRVSPRQLSARGYAQPEPRQVEVDVDGTIVVGQDFDLRRVGIE